jgi:hypothetical protein
MTIFGGIGANVAFLGDTWVLSNANGLGGQPPKWTNLNLIGPVPSRRWNGGVIDTANNLMIMFGGAGDGESAPENSVPLWSTWVLGPLKGR